MIQAVLSENARYRTLHRSFPAAFDWLLQFDPATPDGRIAVAGEDIFALVQTYDTAPAAEKRFETHRERIDIQYLVSGTELMAWSPRTSLTEAVPYNPAKDAVFYADPANATTLLCPPGSFTIFFPEDGHKGGCDFQKSEAIRKVVLKVRV